jgi:hypothetical protein
MAFIQLKKMHQPTKRQKYIMSAHKNSLVCRSKANMMAVGIFIPGFLGRKMNSVQ